MEEEINSSIEEFVELFKNFEISSKSNILIVLNSLLLEHIIEDKVSKGRDRSYTNEVFNILRELKKNINYAIEELNPSRSYKYQKKVKTQQLPKLNTYVVHPYKKSHFSSINCLIDIYFNNSQWLISASDDFSIKLWEISNLNIDHCYTLYGHTSPVLSLIDISFDSNYPRVASGSEEGSLKIWNVEQKACLLTHQGHTDAIACFVTFKNENFSNINLIASGSRSGEIKIWNINKENEIFELLNVNTQHKAIYCMRYLNTAEIKENLLLSGGADHLVRIWKKVDKDLIEYNILKGHEDIVTGITLASTKKIITASMDKTIKLWDVNINQCLKTLYTHDYSIYSLINIHAEGTIISFSSEDKIIYLIDTKNEIIIGRLSGHFGSVKCLINLSINKENYIISGSEDKAIKVWNIENFDFPKCQSTMSDYYVSSLILMNIDTKSYIVAGCTNNTIKLWEFQNLDKCERSLSGHNGLVLSLLNICPKFLSSHHLLASGSNDTTIKIWAIPSGELIRTITGHTSSVFCLKSVYSNKTGKDFIVSGSGDKTIKLFDYITGDCYITLEGHLNQVYSLEIIHHSNYNESFIVSGSYDKEIRVWDYENMKTISQLTGHNGYVICLLFLNIQNSPVIASGSWDKTIRIWDIEYNHCVTVLTGHTSHVKCLNKIVIKNIKDMNLLVSGSDDMRIKLWNIGTWDCIQTIKGHDNSINCLCLVNDQSSDVLISASTDRSIKIWKFKVE